MSEESALHPGRRFLHLCYCCNDADAATEFFVDAFKMRNTMRTPSERSDGSLLGVDGEIEGCASFVHDHRGGRVSPAIEIQGWVDPMLVGVPSTDPFEVGVKAVGFVVSDLNSMHDRLVGHGCTVVHRGASPFADDSVVVTDPTGVMLELVHDESIPDGAGQLHHVRITCTDLGVSLAFYEALGFSTMETGTFTDARFVGATDVVVDANFVRLRLPDEAFEVTLIQWLTPVSHGRHYAIANHAGMYRMALGVDDTRASHDAMVAAGAVFDRPPRKVELRGTPVPDMWICFISDPDGIPYEFVQRPRSAFKQ